MATKFVRHSHGFEFTEEGIQLLDRGTSYELMRDPGRQKNFRSAQSLQTEGRVTLGQRNKKHVRDVLLQKLRDLQPPW